MSNSRTNTAASFPLFGLMFLIFLTLKLTGTIDWSWWWITAPLWGPVVLLLLMIVPLMFLIGRKFR